MPDLRVLIKVALSCTGADVAGFEAPARGTLEVEARRLGMMRRGEQSYIVSGLPGN